MNQEKTPKKWFDAIMGGHQRPIQVVVFGFPASRMHKAVDDLEQTLRQQGRKTARQGFSGHLGDEVTQATSWARRLREEQLVATDVAFLMPIASYGMGPTYIDQETHLFAQALEWTQADVLLVPHTTELEQIDDLDHRHTYEQCAGFYAQLMEKIHHQGGGWMPLSPDAPSHPAQPEIAAAAEFIVRCREHRSAQELRAMMEASPGTGVTRPRL